MDGISFGESELFEAYGDNGDEGADIIEEVSSDSDFWNENNESKEMVSGGLGFFYGWNKF